MKIDDSWYKKPKNKNFAGLEMAGGVVVRKEDSKLLIALVGDTRFSTFSLPKGKIEKDETPLKAAKREIEEELGLSKLKLVRKLDILERYTFKKTSWNRYRYFLFSTKQVSGAQKLTLSEKNYYLKWSNIRKLPEFYWPEQKKLVDNCKVEIIKLFDGL